MIVTLNLADFPRSRSRQVQIEAQHPDDFTLALLETFPDLVLEAARTHRASLKNLPKTQEEYLAELNAQGLPKTVKLLRDLAVSGNLASEDINYSGIPFADFVCGPLNVSPNSDKWSSMA